MKKLLTVCLFLCLVLGLALPAQAAESGTCGEGVTWVYEDGTLTISGTGAMDDFTGGAPWAAYKGSITTLIVGNGVTRIGASAFQNYDSLKSVSFGSGLEEIGASAFKNCDGLTAISLPSAFRTFGASSFENCVNLKTISCAGRCPKFESNSMWNVRAVIYYPADWPWKLSTIQQLEDAFHDRINFLASDGTDPEAGLEEEELVEETTAPTETTVLPTEETVPPTGETMSPEGESTGLRPTAAAGTVAARPNSAPRKEGRSHGEDEEETDGNRIFWLMLLLVIAVAAATAAVVLQIRLSNRRKRRRRRRK